MILRCARDSSRQPDTQGGCPVVSAAARLGTMKNWSEVHELTKKPVARPASEAEVHMRSRQDGCGCG